MKEKLYQKTINEIYIVIVIIILIVTLIISFKTGESIFYLITTDLNNTNTFADSYIAIWNFKVRIEY